MEWLNYHHLRYFYMVAKAGSLQAAAEKLKVSPPSISAQIRELEEALGQPLFTRRGRKNVLTDAGQIALEYAEEIFSLGRELLNALHQRPGSKMMRLYVGVADAFPKLVTNEILQPAFQLPHAYHVICREGKAEDLLTQLAAHRLDLVLTDYPATSSQALRVFNHLLGECGIVFCASPELANRLRKQFPQSLNGAPMLLPTENTAMRRNLNQWFDAHSLEPNIVAEFEDAALMNVMAVDGKGVVPVPKLVVKEAINRYKLQIIGEATDCKERFYAVTAERRLRHPGVVLLTENAQKLLHSSGAA